VVVVKKEEGVVEAEATHCLDDMLVLIRLRIRIHRRS
jgi:hypothetical protein